MEHKKISITTYSVEKITVNVKKGHLRPTTVQNEPDPPTEPAELLPIEIEAILDEKSVLGTENESDPIEQAGEYIKGE
jgi:hypothetical protein